MRRMSEQMDKVVSTYRALAQIPALTNAKLLKKGSEVTSVWAERNLETNKLSKITFNQQIGANLNVLSESSFGVDVSNEVISAVSPLENLRAIVREQMDAKNVKKQYLEVWKYRHRRQCIELPALDIHGDVYADGEFGSFEWDQSENRVIYIAEKKLPKSESFMKRKSVKDKDKTETAGDEKPSKGKEYDFKPEWGEQLVGKHLSVITMCQLDTETFTIFDWLPESWCPGQVCWSPDDSSVTGVAWETEPRRLGLIFCTNRPSYIFISTLDKKTTKISEEKKAVRSPRYSCDGKYLVWLQRDAGGPHHSCHQLVKTEFPVLPKPVIKTVIDIVGVEKTIENGEKFTGIYSAGLPQRCFALDGRRLLFSTPQQTEVRSYVVDIDTGKITDISDKSHPCSTTILDVHEDIVLASRSSLKQPSQLIIAKLPKSGDEKNIKWEVISKDSAPLPDAIVSAKLEYLNLEHKDVQDSVTNFTAIFFGGNAIEPKKQPLIVWPHGGPHSNFSNTYSLEAAFLCMSGFSMVQVNFRGSTGAGQTSLDYLPGRAGYADVKDCILATDKCLELFPVDEQKCVLLGGSHGGFLVTHLSSLPRYKAVVSRNPVTDIATMFNGTDIPDWCTFEAGVEFNEVGPISEELMLTMRRASPMVNAHKVKAPTLLCLGTQDKRVPYFQGMEFYHKIKANGCKARALIYEDNHSLSSTAHEADQMINSVLWFLEHTQ